jgi:hypothetical protein
MRIAALAAALAALLNPLTCAAELGLNLYGAAYHLNRDRAQQLGLDNEFNPGLGLRYRAAASPQWDWFADAGAYRDSGRNTALLAGVGGLWKAGGGWRLGGALALMHSDTYNRGRTFIAPMPVIAYDWGRATLNMTYFPRVSGFNEVDALGFWVTLPFR